MSFAMSRDECQQFLAEQHVGVLSVVENGSPLTVPIWYGYQPGGTVQLITGRESRKTRAVEATGWLTMCAQDEAWPYKYVTAAGPAAVAGPASYAVQRTMASRYLGDDGAEQFMSYVIESGEADEQIIIEMTPRTWLSADYSKPAHTS